MRHFLRSAILVATLVLTGGAASAQQGSDETVLKATYGAWEVHCLASNDKACYMSQVGKSGDGKPLVRVRIQKTPNLKGPKGQKIPALIQIQAPLGVLLTAGLALQVDSAKPGLAPFRFCTPKNCVVEEPVDDDLVARLKKGNKAIFGVVSALSGQRSEANVSLSGFTKAYNNL